LKELTGELVDAILDDDDEKKEEGGEREEETGKAAMKAFIVPISHHRGSVLDDMVGLYYTFGV
jgi:hypothetical protein